MPKRTITMGDGPAGSRYEVPALTKGMRILEAIAEHPALLGISEIVQRIGVPKTSAFVILSTLQDLGYVEKRPDGKYSLGIRLFHLGMAAAPHADLRKAAVPVMGELAEQTGFTVHLATLEHGEAVYIEKVEGPGFVKFNTHIGMRQPLHLTGVGKALAAFLPEEDLDRIIADKGFPARTPNTITNAWEFKRFLSTVRANGYAIEDEEGEPGIRCIGAPVRDRSGQVVASISVTAVRADLPGTRFGEVGTLVRQAADRISGRLGEPEPG